MSDVIRRLVTVLGFDSEDKKAEKYDKALADIGKTAKRATVAVSALAGSIALSIKTYTSTADAAIKLGRSIEFGADELLSLQYAAQRTGSTAEGLTSAIQTFSSGLSQASIGQGSAREAFARLGVQIWDTTGKVKSANELFPEVADSIAKLGSRAEQIALTEQLFGGDGRRFLLLLQNGSRGIAQLQRQYKRLGGGLQGSTKDVERFQDAWLDFKTIVGGIKNAVAADLLPAVNEILTSFRKWFESGQRLIRLSITQEVRDFANAVRRAWRFVSDIAGKIDTWVTSWTTWGKVVKAIGVAFATWKLGAIVSGLSKLAAMAALPTLFWMLVAAVTALVALDIYGWVNGQTSAIELLLGKYDDFIRRISSADGILYWLEKISDKFLEFLGINKLVNSLLGAPGYIKWEQENIGKGPQASQMPGVTNQKSNVAVTNNVTVKAPEGSTESQMKALKDIVTGSVMPELERQMRNTIDSLGARP